MSRGARPAFPHLPLTERDRDAVHDCTHTRYYRRRHPPTAYTRHRYRVCPNARWTRAQLLESKPLGTKIKDLEAKDRRKAGQVRRAEQAVVGAEAVIATAQAKLVDVAYVCILTWI